jgi:hypothetical protein
MTHYGTWVSYGGAAEIELAAILAGAAAAVAYAGFRLPLPARLPGPSAKVRVVMLAIWLVSIVAFIAGLAIYVEHALREHLGAHAAAADPITPVTVIGVGIIWFAVALLHNGRGWRVGLGSGLIAALAAPWIFEVPFDLIVMARTLPLPPDPVAYRILFFAPLLAVGITTVALLTLSPVARLSRATFWCFAAMLAVFAIWSMIGFGYPSTPAPFALNVVSKVLALLTALSMFLPDRSTTKPRVAADEIRAAAPTASAWTGVM